MYEGFSTCVARHTRTERALQFVGFLCGINRHEACFAEFCCALYWVSRFARAIAETQEIDWCNELINTLMQLHSSKIVDEKVC